MPMWQDVAMQLAEEDPKGKRKLVMGKFDCEQVDLDVNLLALVFHWTSLYAMRVERTSGRETDKTSVRVSHYATRCSVCNPEAGKSSLLSSCLCLSSFTL